MFQLAKKLIDQVTHKSANAPAADALVVLEGAVLEEIGGGKLVPWAV